MTDIDAMNKHVTKLVAWKAEVQQAISQFKTFLASADQVHAGGDDSASQALSRRVDDLSSKFDELAEQLAPAAAQMGQVQSLQAEVDDFKAKFPPERVDALDFMLTWFQDNQDALAVLLTLGDDDTTVDEASGGSVETAETAPAAQVQSDTPAPQTTSAGAATAIPVNPTPVSPGNPLPLPEAPLPSGAETLDPVAGAATGASATPGGTSQQPSNPDASTGS